MTREALVEADFIFYYRLLSPGVILCLIDFVLSHILHSLFFTFHFEQSETVSYYYNVVVEEIVFTEVENMQKAGHTSKYAQPSLNSFNSIESLS